MLLVLKMCSCNSWIFMIAAYLILILLLLKVFQRFTLGIAKSNTYLLGKTVLVTGGNSGIGYETALALAGRGARIIIADKADATETVNRIIKATDNKNITYKYLDLSSFACIRRFAKEINEEEDRLDILINNAGIGGVGDQLTKDGIVIGLQVNYYGPFLLTHLLADLLKRSAPSRIIFVSSLLAFSNNLTLSNMNEFAVRNNSVESAGTTYGNSKLMVVIASNIFARTLRSNNVTCNSVHPGIVKTEIYSKTKEFADRPFAYFIWNIILRFYGKDAWEGAQTQIHCALSKDLENVTGKYFVDCKTFRQPWKIGDREFCAKVWEASENLVHLRDNERLS